MNDWKEKSFETYLISDSNKVAYQAARAIASCPGDICNPLLLYGPNGCGKTHLLHAVKSHVKVYHPDLSCTLLNCADLIDSFITGHHKNDYSLLNNYLSADILLLDHSHILAGKSATQE